MDQKVLGRLAPRSRKSVAGCRGEEGGAIQSLAVSLRELGVTFCVQQENTERLNRDLQL